MDDIGSRVSTRLAEALPGVSQAELARRVGMDPSALSRAVNGKRGLAVDELVAIARELRVSTDWLLVGEDRFPVAIAARHTYVDQTYSADLDGIDDAVRGVVLAYERAAELAELPSRPVPRDPAQARRLLTETAGPEWPRHLAAAVEQTFGVDVVKVASDNAEGVSLALPNAHVVIVPTAVAWSRQNWTIAHELAHIASDDFVPLAQAATSERDREAAANAYAAEVLLPAADLRAVDWDTVDEAFVARFLWSSGVSIVALNHRLATLGLAQVDHCGSPLALLRRHIAGSSPLDDPITARRQEAGARRFPSRLIAAHESDPRSGRILAWMLGVVPAEEEEVPPSPDLDALARELGLLE